MKCSSRRDCNTQTEMGKQAWASSLNEVQLPKELQRGAQEPDVHLHVPASMKCSSRRNCNLDEEDALVLDEVPQ